MSWKHILMVLNTNRKHFIMWEMLQVNDTALIQKRRRTKEWGIKAASHEANLHFS